MVYAIHRMIGLKIQQHKSLHTYPITDYSLKKRLSKMHSIKNSSKVSLWDLRTCPYVDGVKKNPTPSEAHILTNQPTLPSTVCLVLLGNSERTGPGDADQ